MAQDGSGVSASCNVYVRPTFGYDSDDHTQEVAGIAYRYYGFSGGGSGIFFTEGYSLLEVINKLYQGHVHIPETPFNSDSRFRVISIASEAFKDCDALTRVDIPSSVNTIYSGAFQNCSSLAIVSTESEYNISNDAFDSQIYQNATLYVPKGKVSFYKTLSGWKNFKKIVEVPDEVMVSQITLNATNKELTAGQTFQLSATVLPSNATNNSVTWSSNNTSVATVSTNGLVTAVADGSATITCTAQDGSGVKASCNISVSSSSPIETDLLNHLAVPNVTAFSGKQVVLPIELENEGTLAAVQFDIHLPNGVSIAKDEDGYLLIDNTSRDSRHTLDGIDLGGGKYRIMLYSSSVRPITGNSGSIVDITLSVGADAQEGGHTIRLTDIVFSSTTAEKTIGADVTATITISSVQPGDADGDGVIDVNDITNVAAHILGNNPANFNAAAADADGDGVIDVNDITVISRIILNGGQ